VGSDLHADQGPDKDTVKDVATGNMATNMMQYLHPDTLVPMRCVLVYYPLGCSCVVRGWLCSA